MRIKDTKANKIFMLLSLIILMILVFSPRIAKRETLEQNINVENGITIEAFSANINIWVDENLNEAKVVYKTKDSNELEISNSKNGETVIKEKQKNKFFNISFDNENPTISLYLPTNEVDDLTLKSLSGSIETFNPLEAKNITIDSASGDISLLDIKVDEKLDIKTISADISLDDTISDTLKIASASGDVDTDKIESSSISIASISGEINLLSTVGKSLKISSTSADIDVEFLDISDSITLSTISGDIEANAADKTYKYKVTTTSGDIKINTSKYEKSYKTENGIPFNINTISGEIDIFTK